MKHLKLFFALFAMLALGVGNAWAEEATLSFADKAQRTSYSTTKQVWEQNGITFTNNKASSTNNVADYAKPVRLYAKSEVIVDAPGNITKIVFNCNNTTYANALKNSVGAEASVSSKAVTVVPTATNTSYTIASLTAQVRLDNIVVTYEKVASSDPSITCSNSVNFGVVKANANTTKELVVSAENLTENITATLTAGTAFTVSGNLTAIGGTLTLTVTAIEEGTYTDILKLTSGSATNEVEVSATVVVCEGEGTEENPYTIDDVKKLSNPTPTITAWVEGYIVGVMKDNKFSSTDLSVNSNLALAATVDDTDIVPVALPSTSGSIRTDLNLVDNPGNLGKKVAVYGTLENYFSTTGVTNTSNYKWVAAEGAPEAPTFTPAAGTYFAAQNVTITAEEGATIYYTIDGTDPTTESTVYSAPIAVGETTTVKAIAVKAEQLSPVASAKYTINLPLTTMDQIFAKATEVGSTATSVQVVMNNWVVTGVKGSNAYLTDGTKGLIIYTASHGFNVGDILSGTVACKVQLYNGSSELTELTNNTEGLTVSTGGVVTPVVVSNVTTLSGVNTGSVIKITGTCTVDGTKYYVNGVQLYNSLFAFESLEGTKSYNVTGVYLQYNTTKEILPRSQEDIEKLDVLPTATITIADITMEVGEEKTISATIDPEDAQVTYALTTGTCINLNGTTITAIAVGSATITATVVEKAGEYNGTTKTFNITVTAPNIATLPFTFDGKQADIANTLGMSHTGVDASDYSSSPHLKFNHAGDNLIVHFDSQAGEFSFVLKQNGSNAGTFTVYESANGEDYTPVWTGGDLGGNGQSKTITPTLAAVSRYVKFEYTTKGTSTNYGLGNIKIALPSEEPEQPGGGETPGERLTEWVLTPLADITTNDLVVITMTKGETTWAMTNNNGTSAAPAAPVVTLSADALAAEPDKNLKWVVSNDNGTLTIYPYGGYETWLYSTTSNNGIRVGTSENKTFKIDDTYGYLYNIPTDRYVGVYNNADWRSYTSMHANISDQTLKFFVKKNANDILPGTGEDPDEPGDDPVVPTPTINPTATFIFNTAEGLNDLGITYPATADEDTEGAFKTEFENNATFTQDGITMTTTGGTVVATRVWLTKNGALDLRVYKGATLTFSVPAEHKISAIVFDGSNIGHLLVNGNAVSGNAWTGSAQTITFTAKDDAKTIKINTIAFVVEYTRDVTNKYGTICLPYASASTSGAYFYEVVGKGTENGKPAVYLASVNSLKAGVPYIFEKTANTIKVVYSSEKVDAPQNNDANGLVGTFTEITVPDGDYILYYDAFCTNKDGAVNKIRANRAYLDMDAVTGGAPVQMPGRRYIGMSVQGENEATGFENITAPEGQAIKVIENGQLIIIRGGEKFNVQGQKL